MVHRRRRRIDDPYRCGSAVLRPIFFWPISLPVHGMTVIDNRSPPPSSVESKAVELLRDRLLDVLPNGIPPDLDTDLNLLRWLRGQAGDLDLICENFRNYVSSREAAGFIGDDLHESFFEREDIKQYLPYITHCRLLDTVWNDDLNAFLFVERAWAQPKEFIKTLKTSDYLMHCFGYSEMLLQLILRRERQQAPTRGAVQFIVLFDLSAVNITDYLNPMSGYMKLWQLRSEMWQNWYPDMVQRIFLLNPPRLVGVLWKLVRLFLNERNCRLIEICSEPKELLKHLPKYFVPKEFGGEYVNKLMGGDASGVTTRSKITSCDHYKALQHYRKRGVDRARPTHKDLVPNEVFRVPIACLSGQSLCWDFLSSGELDFHIFTNQDEFDMVYPKLRLATSKLPEEGALDNLPTGEYVLQFVNPSNYFTIKLDYSITLVN